MAEHAGKARYGMVEILILPCMAWASYLSLMYCATKFSVSIRSWYICSSTIFLLQWGKSASWVSNDCVMIASYSSRVVSQRQVNSNSTESQQQLKASQQQVNRKSTENQWLVNNFSCYLLIILIMWLIASFLINIFAHCLAWWNIIIWLFQNLDLSEQKKLETISGHAQEVLGCFS